MSEVTLSIGGRDYAVACADGEETHIARLGETIDAKLQQLGGNLSARDAQNLLFAALLLADELHEQRATVSEAADLREQIDGTMRNAREALAEREDTIATLRAELAELKAQHKAQSTAPAGFGDPDLAPALERFADLLENCADKLESSAEAS